MKKTLADQLAQYAFDLKFESLPSPVVQEVKRRIIDSLGCALGAWDSEPGQIARRVAGQFTTSKGATLLGTAQKTSPDWAAFANGCLVRYFDYNDTYLSKEPAHPSDNIPAALAVAEMEQAAGKDLIISIVLAYEIQCRLCDAASLRSRGWDHVTYGVFSTALASGKLMKLNLEQLKQAVNIAGVASAALRQSRVGELSYWKGCAFANAARQGVFSALLAREGMTGPAPIFEGDKGFEKLVSGSLEEFQLPANDFMILKTYIKFWPAEYHSQSAIEAALQLRSQIGSVDDIESIVIHSHDAAVDIIGSELEKWNPTNRETADHSLPYIVAAALMDGEITSRQFELQRIAEPKLKALVQRIKVDRDAELSELYPGAIGNRIELLMKNGKRFSLRIDHPRGHPKNRMADEEVEKKFHTLSNSFLGNERGKMVIQKIWKIEEVNNWDDFLSLLKKDK